MRKNMFVLSGTLMLCGLSGIAAAQEAMPPPAPKEAPPPGVAPAPGEPVRPPGTTAYYQSGQPIPQAQPAKPRAAYSPANQSITGGGGVADFVRSRNSSTTDISGTWDFRYVGGTRSFLAFEGSYVGTAGNVNNEIGGNVSTQLGTGAL